MSHLNPSPLAHGQHTTTSSTQNDVTRPDPTSARSTGWAANNARPSAGWYDLSNRPTMPPTSDGPLQASPSYGVKAGDLDALDSRPRAPSVPSDLSRVRDQRMRLAAQPGGLESQRTFQSTLPPPSPLKVPKDWLQGARAQAHLTAAGRSVEGDTISWEQNGPCHSTGCQRQGLTYVSFDDVNRGSLMAEGRIDSSTEIVDICWTCSDHFRRDRPGRWTRADKCAMCDCAGLRVKQYRHSFGCLKHFHALWTQFRGPSLRSARASSNRLRGQGAAASSNNSDNSKSGLRTPISSPKSRLTHAKPAERSYPPLLPKPSRMSSGPSSIRGSEATGYPEGSSSSS